MFQSLWHWGRCCARLMRAHTHASGMYVDSILLCAQAESPAVVDRFDRYTLQPIPSSLECMTLLRCDMEKLLSNDSWWRQVPRR